MQIQIENRNAVIVEKAGGQVAKRKPSRGSAGLTKTIDTEHRRCGTRKFASRNQSRIKGRGAAPTALWNARHVYPGLPPLGSRLALGPPGLGSLARIFIFRVYGKTSFRAEILVGQHLSN